MVLAWKSHLNWKKKFKLVSRTLPIVLLFLLNSCNAGPEPIIVGKDHCDYCKMPYGDNRFGAEVITDKGKFYKFDDEHCLESFLKEPANKKDKSNSFYFVDFSGDHSLIPARASFFLNSASLRSPMAGNIAAFANKDSLLVVENKYPGTEVTWDQLIKP